jgi:hypothetical protein
MYDGTSFAKNQDVVLVSFNYRTNVFGFPMAQDLPASLQNLGFLDQELALAWVQDNIAQFGGDRTKVTIMVRPVLRETHVNIRDRFCGDRATPRGLRLSHLQSRAGIRTSSHHSVQPSCFPEKGSPLSPNLTSHFSTRSRLQWDVRSHQAQSGWNAFAKSLLLRYATIRTETPLTCLLRKLISKHSLCRARGVFSCLTMSFGSVTFFDDPLQSIRTGQIARVPILLGSMENDGTVFTSVFPNVSAFYANQFASLGASFRPPNLATLYPGLTGTQPVSAVIRDVWFLWCALRLLWAPNPFMLTCCSKSLSKLWSDAFVTSGIKGVYRYTYGTPMRAYISLFEPMDISACSSRCNLCRS